MSTPASGSPGVPNRRSISTRDALYGGVSLGSRTVKSVHLDLKQIAHCKPARPGVPVQAYAKEPPWAQALGSL